MSRKRVCQAARLLLAGFIAPFFAAQTSVFAAPNLVSGVVSQAEERIPNLSEVAPNLYRGCQPDAQALAKLKEAGIKVDVSLDYERHAIKQERAAAEAVGLKFISIPLLPIKHPSQKAIETFLSVAQNKDAEPVYVHCVHGRDRTGAMIGIYRIAMEGWSADDAYAEMLRKGFRPFFTPLSDAVFAMGREKGLPAHKPSAMDVATGRLSRATGVTP